MANRKLFLLPGDGIGPEAFAEMRKIIDHMNAEEGAGFEFEEGLVGGAAYDAHGESISDADMEKAMAADAVIFGAVFLRWPLNWPAHVTTAFAPWKNAMS